MSDDSTGAYGVAEAVPALVVGVLAPHQDVLVPHEVGPLVDHPGSRLDPDRVTATEMGAQLRTVAAALVVPAQEVLILKKNDLQEKKYIKMSKCMKDLRKNDDTQSCSPDKKR